MIKLKINNRRYKLKSRFTIEDWQETIKLDMEDPKSWPKILSIGFNQPYWKFHNVEEDSLILGSSLVLNHMGGRRECKMRDLTTLKLGEFIDLDICMIMGAEKHIHAILDIISVKPIKYIDEALWLVDQFANFRISTYRSYAGLFGLNKNGESEDEEDLEGWDPQKVAKGWYRVLVDLTDDDLLKLDEVTEQPLKKAFNFMALRKEKVLEENFKQLQQKRQYDLQRNRR